MSLLRIGLEECLKTILINPLYVTDENNSIRSQTQLHIRDSHCLVDIKVIKWRQFQRFTNCKRFTLKM